MNSQKIKNGWSFNNCYEADGFLSSLLTVINHLGSGNKMKKLIIISAVAALVTACTSVQVQPIGSGLNPQKICIEENPKVIVGDFLSVVRNRIEYHGIDTEVYENKAPKGCEYIMTYTALKNWDLGTYMHHAELRLEHNGKRVGYAEYHLNRKGGLSLMKWQGTKTKMDPVVDELLGK